MWYEYYPFIPRIPNTNEKPPTIYAILNSYCNGASDDFLEDNYITPSNLAKNGRSAIFDFDYPLSYNVSKEKFEEMILNKFMMRRIGYESLTAFKIALNVKLNEIMPKYNKLFDALVNWNLFEDGEGYTRNYNESRNDSGETTSQTSSSSETTSDRRFSALPQNELQSIKDGNYMTDYNLDNDTNDLSTSNNSASSTNGKTNISEIIKRSPADKLRIYKEMLDDENNIYTMIFKELNSLFYALV